MNEYRSEYLHRKEAQQEVEQHETEIAEKQQVHKNSKLLAIGIAIVGIAMLVILPMRFRAIADDNGDANLKYLAGNVNTAILGASSITEARSATVQTGDIQQLAETLMVDESVTFSETSHSIDAYYALVDGELQGQIAAGEIGLDELKYDERCLVQSHPVALFDANESSIYYVGLIDEYRVDGTGQTEQVDFSCDGEVIDDSEGIIYDNQTGIVYVPKLSRFADGVSLESEIVGQDEQSSETIISDDPAVTGEQMIEGEGDKPVDEDSTEVPEDTEAMPTDDGLSEAEGAAGENPSENETADENASSDGEDFQETMINASEEDGTDEGKPETVSFESSTDAINAAPAMEGTDEEDAPAEEDAPIEGEVPVADDATGYMPAPASVLHADAIVFLNSTEESGITDDEYVDSPDLLAQGEQEAVDQQDVDFQNSEMPANYDTDGQEDSAETEQDADLAGENAVVAPAVAYSEGNLLAEHFRIVKTANLDGRVPPKTMSFASYKTWQYFATGNGVTDPGITESYFMNTEGTPNVVLVRNATRMSGTEVSILGWQVGDGTNGLADTVYVTCETHSSDEEDTEESPSVEGYLIMLTVSSASPLTNIEIIDTTPVDESVAPVVNGVEEASQQPITHTYASIEEAPQQPQGPPDPSKAIKITYNANGGTGSMAQTQTGPGQKVKLSKNTFTRSGYTFQNWNSKQNGSGDKFNDQAEIEARGDLTLYAQWTKNAAAKTITVKFNKNGATGGNMTNQTMTAGTTTALKANAFTCTGYTFKNWNTKADGKGTAYANKASVKLNANTTLYAQWTKNAAAKTITVKFNKNGATGGSMTNQTMTAGAATALKANAFTCTGYTFKNWNTKANGKGTAYANKASVKLNANITLYAQWTKNAAAKTITVKFNKNGGTGTMANQTMTVNTATALKANTFTRTGYTFKGWNTKADGKGTGYTNRQSVKLTTNTTLYAQWTATQAATPTTPSTPQTPQPGQQGSQTAGSAQASELASQLTNMITQAGGTITPELTTQIKSLLSRDGTEIPAEMMTKITAAVAQYGNDPQKLKDALTQLLAQGPQQGQGQGTQQAPTQPGQDVTGTQTTQQGQSTGSGPQQQPSAPQQPQQGGNAAAGQSDRTPPSEPTPPSAPGQEPSAQNASGPGSQNGSTRTSQTPPSEPTPPSAPGQEPSAQNASGPGSQNGSTRTSRTPPSEPTPPSAPEKKEEPSAPTATTSTNRTAPSEPSPPSAPTNNKQVAATGGLGKLIQTGDAIPVIGGIIVVAASGAGLVIYRRRRCNQA